MRRCYPPQLELVSLFLVILTVYIALSNYSALPDTIPIHFDAQGVPDDWSSKGMIWLFPILSAVFFPSLTVLYWWFAIVDDPKRFINLPGGRSRMETMTREQKEKLRVFVNRSLFVLKILTLGLITYLTWQTVEVALGRASSMGLFIWLFAGAILIVTGYMVWKCYRLTKTPTQMNS